MASLILCKENLSSLPFYLESAAKHIYSLEELFYYMKENPYLAVWDVKHIAFCNWMEENNINPSLAKELKEEIIGEVKFVTFLTTLMQSRDYFSEEEMTKLIKIALEMENKSPVECLILKADHWLKARKYISAMKEYKQVLSSEEKKILSNEQLGNIWNNLGTAYANLFFFEEAVWCYKKAFSYNQNEKSKIAMEKAKVNADTFDGELKRSQQTTQDLMEQDFFEQNVTFEMMDGNDDLLEQWKKEYIAMADMKDWSTK